VLVMLVDRAIHIVLSVMLRFLGFSFVCSLQHISKGCNAEFSVLENSVVCPLYVLCEVF